MRSSLQTDSVRICVRDRNASVNCRVNRKRNSLENERCHTHITHIGNLLAYLFGLISLVIVIPSTIPFLGWGNWIALPLIVIGIVFGALSSSDGGRNFCLIVLLVAAIRLSIGGGII